ncbi:MAG: YicC family protein [Clostridia bacterium]|nr:YicC family protein [Clostridia bacterium]
MLKSMTGFGKGTAACGSGTVTVEIKTVNSKSLDLSIKMPRELSAFETTVRKALRDKVSRGKVDVYVGFERSVAAGTGLKIDWELADAFYEAEKEACERFGVKFDFSPTQLFRLPDVFTVEKAEPDEKELETCVSGAASMAVEKLLEMRSLEGEYLDGEIRRLVGEIEDAFEVIKNRAPYVSAEYKDKLTERLLKLLDNANMIDEQRLAQEVALFADRCDITEETARIDSHLKQIGKYLDSGLPAGREIDFVLQEFKREINTLGSKSNDGALFEAVLTVKSRLEMLREQIQNIE